MPKKSKKGAKVKATAFFNAPKPVVEKNVMDIGFSSKTQMAENRKRVQRSRKKKGKAPRKARHPRHSGLAGLKYAATAGAKAALVQLEPYSCKELDITSAYPIAGESKASHKFWTTMDVNIPVFSYNGNAKRGARFFVNPTMVDHIMYATAFNTDGAPVTDAFTGINDPAVDISLTSFPYVRMVACEVRVRNLTAVQNQTGLDLIGLSTNEEAKLNPTSSLQNGLTFYLHTAADPGSIMRMTWRGSVTSEATTSTAIDGFFASPTAVTDVRATSILYHYETNTATGSVINTINVQVVTQWEAQVNISSQCLFNLTFEPFESAAYIEGLHKSLSVPGMGAYDKGRCVLKDDGEDRSVLDDFKSVFSGVKGLWDSGKSLVSGVSGIASSIMSLFGTRNKRIAIHALKDEIQDFVQLYHECKGDPGEMIKVLDGIEEQGRIGLKIKEMEPFFKAWSNSQKEDYLAVTDSPVSTVSKSRSVSASRK